MIIKSEKFEIEVFAGAEFYFASKLFGQIFKKWDDLEDNEKLILEILQKIIERLILEFTETLFAKELIERHQIQYNGQIPDEDLQKIGEVARLEDEKQIRRNSKIDLSNRV